jgi:ATP-dependent Clp protease adaptor protein ClpS
MLFHYICTNIIKKTMTIKEKKLPDSETGSGLDSGKKLVLFNDNVHTFDFVIETLVEVCNHDPEQAENCALIAHFKGKCAVKNGSFEELKPCYEEMVLRKLTVEIQ